MSKYNKILSEFVKQTTLKRIRIKSDPSKYESNLNCSPVGYEGYILEETPDGDVVVFVPDLQDNILSLGSDEYEQCGSENTNLLFAPFKEFVIKYLVDNNYVKDIQDGLMNVESTSNVHELNTFLKNKNLDNEELIDLYKSFISNG
tara:strand:- start:84 stop:521 length:438 start_codon:yes stop_codon:yes gene_type:complete